MHLKNFSLIETSEGSLEYVLSPAYDLLPVNLLLPEDKEQMALTVNGKKTNIRKKDFLILADHAEVKREVAERLISSLLAKEKPIIQLCQESLLPEDMKQSFIDLTHTTKVRCLSIKLDAKAKRAYTKFNSTETESKGTE